MRSGSRRSRNFLPRARAGATAIAINGAEAAVGAGSVKKDGCRCERDVNYKAQPGKAKREMNKIYYLIESYGMAWKLLCKVKMFGMKTDPHQSMTSVMSGAGVGARSRQKGYTFPGAGATGIFYSEPALEREQDILPAGAGTIQFFPSSSFCLSSGLHRRRNF